MAGEEKTNELEEKKIFTSNAQRTTTVEKGETIIELNDVTIRFNKNNLKVDNLKEYFVRLVTRQLMFQEFIALKNINLTIKKGDAIGQAIFMKYEIADNDNATGKRTGGFGSTNKKEK